MEMRTKKKMVKTIMKMAADPAKVKSGLLPSASPIIFH
jgi:hypothetical protein